MRAPLDGDMMIGAAFIKDLKSAVSGINEGERPSTERLELWRRCQDQAIGSLPVVTATSVYATAPQVFSSRAALDTFSGGKIFRPHTLLYFLPYVYKNQVLGSVLLCAIAVNHVVQKR